MTNETDKHTLHRLYFLGIRKKTNKIKQRFERSQNTNIKKHKSIKNPNRVGCPIKTFFLSNGASNFLSPCFLFFLFQMHFLPTSSPPKDAFPFRPQVSSQLSNQTAAVNSTRAQSSSSTQQPRDRYTALLSPAVDLLLSLSEADLPCLSLIHI